MHTQAHTHPSILISTYIFWHMTVSPSVFNVTSLMSLMVTIFLEEWSLSFLGHPLSAPMQHDDVIKCKHFPHYWPFVRGIHRPPMNSTHKGQWHGAFMFSLICAWTNGWVNNRYAGDLRHHRAHHVVTVVGSKVTRNERAGPSRS